MKKKQLLMFEGITDVKVISKILENREVVESFERKEYQGIDGVFANVSTVLKTAYETVGIVLDADNDISNVWERLKSILANLGYDVPNDPNTYGTILKEKGKRTVGIWIMPDNENIGMLENFLMELVPSDDALFPYVDRVLEDIELQGLNLYTKAHKHKVRIHTWLAWQKEPGLPLGIAITKEMFNQDAELCTRFVNWVNDLFNS